jgi:hypothetical protein
MLAAATVKISSSFHQYTGLRFGSLLGGLQNFVLENRNGAILIAFSYGF